MPGPSRDGIKRTTETAADASIRHRAGQKLNYAVVGLLVLAVAYMAVDVYVLTPRRGAPAVDASGVSAGRVPTDVAPPAGDRLPKSVAVLPFDNLSADSDDAYFAIGLHDEILNRLAKLRSLTVISRTTVLRYTEQRPPIPEIAAELNVETVMEGSVRYAGDRIQVTVQLIDGRTDAHIWSESYPGDLSDLATIFALQADIATNVASALQAELSPQERQLLAELPTESAEAYELYLAATTAFGGSKLWSTASSSSTARSISMGTLAPRGRSSRSYIAQFPSHSPLAATRNRRAPRKRRGARLS